MFAFGQVPVCTEQLMRCARAREAGSRNSAFGHPKAKLSMGVVRDFEEGEEKQRFSVDAKDSEPYEPKVPWLGQAADLGKLSLEGRSGLKSSSPLRRLLSKTLGQIPQSLFNKSSNSFSPNSAIQVDVEECGNGDDRERMSTKFRQRYFATESGKYNSRLSSAALGACCELRDEINFFCMVSDYALSK